MNAEIILQTEGLTKRFSGFTAVDRVDLAVRKGSIHALIGPNGAGKSTCFNLCTKFLEPSAGAIRFRGQPITGHKPAQVSRMGMVRSFQISAVFPEMSARENVRLALQRPTRGSLSFLRSKRSLASLDARADALLDEVGLSAFRHLRAAELSYGRKRALEIATTLALEPELMLLDEPMAGMGVEDIDRIASLIKRVGANRTVLMVEHNLSVVARLCDRITVLARGRVIAEGDYATVSSNPQVRDAYMGSGHE